MDIINRQKFLAELGKLLSFMYEEDRQRALSMYERMFDITEDEQGLIQHLISPTRQAVVIARAYDAKDRKLSVSSQLRGDSAEGEGSEMPGFVLAINKIFDDLFPDTPEEELQENQVSFFDMGLAEKNDFVAERPSVPSGAVLLSDTQKFRLEQDEAAAVGAADSEALEDGVPQDAGVPADEPSDPDAEPDYLAGGASIDELLSAWKKDLEGETVPAEEAADDLSVAADAAVVPEEVLPAAEGFSAEAAEAAGAEVFPASKDSGTDQAEAFFPDDLPAEAGSELLEEALPPSDAEETAPLAPEQDSEAEDIVEEEVPARTQTAAVQKQLSVPKLILFLVIAIPVTLALLVLLLIPAGLFLSAAVGVIALGGTLAVSAFSGFSILADLLLLLGAALVVLAFGLLFLWLAIWVVVSGMGGLIRSVRNLGRRLCMKEVPIA